MAQRIVSSIRDLGVHARFMHVCGTHQDTIVKHGLDAMLRDCGVDITQGPGCPVCVTTPLEIEEAIQLARGGKIITSFGDMIRVPGLQCCLQDMNAQGCDVRTVYSIEDAVGISRSNKDREVVFVAVGFETTAPTTASVLLSDPPSNFSVLCCHRLIPPALKAILDMGEIRIDGFIEPGHVSTVIGSKPYECITERYRIPQVIAGFEPLDVLMGVYMLAKMFKDGEARVVNEYKRAVRSEGNVKAQRVVDMVFSRCGVKWRGFPVIDDSGLALRRGFSRYDARLLFEDELEEVYSRDYGEPPGCRCGEVLRGLCSSRDCSLFGVDCTPDHPVGPCMVSVEGSCHIEYRYSSV
ncbi:MAG: hydrogenase formation protein HypD [Candidatus Thermoplasmatota archaeon]